jgi:hypothetical protein
MTSPNNLGNIASTESREAELPQCVLAAHPGPWQLCGRGIYVWTVFRVYWASLYTQSGTYEPDMPAILDLSYLRTLSKEQTVSISIEEMLRLRPEYSNRAPSWRLALTPIIPDVKAGDRLVGCFDRAYGASFYSDQKCLGQVNDPDFASAFLAIWLDPATRAGALRTALLGREAIPSSVEMLP